jgi:hypothetical protein
LPISLIRRKSLPVIVSPQTIVLACCLFEVIWKFKWSFLFFIRQFLNCFINFNVEEYEVSNFEKGVQRYKMINLRALLHLLNEGFACWLEILWIYKYQTSADAATYSDSWG